MFDIASYKPSIGSLLLFAAYWLLVSNFVKFVAVKWPNQFLTPLALGA